MPEPLLSRRALLLGGMETTYNTAVATSAANDALLVSEPRWSANVAYLQRNLNRGSISPVAGMTGRKEASITFTTEIRGNGRHASGLIANAPMLSRLLRAAGFSLTAVAAPTARPVQPVGLHQNDVTWATSGTPTTDVPVPYIIKCVTGGALGTARVRIFSPVAGEASVQAGLIVPATGALSIGTRGLSITPTAAGPLTVGQTWFTYLMPAGFIMQPVSTGFESMTMRLYIDGVLHVMTGCRGTFSMSAKAGELGSMSWTFTGQYSAPTDAAVPANANLEKALPSMFEKAQLTIDGYDAVVDNMSLDIRNDIQIRPDANSPEGYLGTRLVNRAPTMGIDPEATLVADQNFWQKLSDGTQMPFTCRFGDKVGNTVYLLAPSTQYTGLSYADRNGITNMAAEMQLSGIVGDDEVQFLFV